MCQNAQIDILAIRQEAHELALQVMRITLLKTRLRSVSSLLTNTPAQPCFGISPDTLSRSLA